MVELNFLNYLKLININPDYYNNGIVDGYATEAVFTFEELEGSYDVLYMAETYSTQVRYYTDESNKL